MVIEKTHVYITAKDWRGAIEHIENARGYLESSSYVSTNAVTMALANIIKARYTLTLFFNKKFKPVYTGWKQVDRSGLQIALKHIKNAEDILLASTLKEGWTSLKPTYASAREELQLARNRLG